MDEEGLCDTKAHVVSGYVERRTDSRYLGATALNDHRGSVRKPAGQLDGLSGVLFGERSRIVLGWGLEPQQLRKLATGVSPVLTGGGQQTQGFDVLAAGALADESAGHGIACANPRGHCAAGGDVPSAGVEALTAASSHAFDLDK